MNKCNRSIFLYSTLLYPFLFFLSLLLISFIYPFIYLNHPFFIYLELTFPGATLFFLFFLHLPLALLTFLVLISSFVHLCLIHSSSTHYLTPIDQPKSHVPYLTSSVTPIPKSFFLCHSTSLDSSVSLVPPFGSCFFFSF